MSRAVLANEFPGSVNGMQFRFRYPARIDPYEMSRASRTDRIAVLQYLQYLDLPW